jgi:iron complex transport system ATP-binding protein
VNGNANALAFDKVSIRLGDRQILDGVSLELPKGELLGLLGANGAGKTTLLRLAARILRPDRGRVLLGGRELDAIPRRELARRLAVVPQDTFVPFAFRAGELVLMGRAPHLGLLGFESSADLARARAAMERIGVASLAARSVLQLSGGERQLVTVARALAQDPEVLLLDEPTAFLDLRHRVEVLDVLRELARDGRAALVVSHDLGLAARFCDRVALLAAGRIAAVGPPAEVLRPPILREAFGIEADVVPGPDGTPVVIPKRTARQASASERAASHRRA